jgi:Flp pilus assembly protein TadG
MSVQHLPIRPTRAFTLSRLWPHQSGIAAVEFALILPILLVLWIGGVEVTSALSVDRRLNNFAASMGDLVSRAKTVTYTDVDDLFELTEAAMFPYDATGMTMRITAVTIEPSGSTKVAWSRARGMTAYAKDTVVNSTVPATLRPPSTSGSQIIMSEVFYTYRPAVGYVITSNVELEERVYFVPRLGSNVKICATSDQASCVDSI